MSFLEQTSPKARRTALNQAAPKIYKAAAKGLCFSQMKGKPLKGKDRLKIPSNPSRSKGDLVQKVSALPPALQG